MISLFEIVVFVNKIQSLEEEINRLKGEKGKLTSQAQKGKRKGRKTGEKVRRSPELR